MIVNTNTLYSSAILEDNINSLLDKYPFLIKKIIGYSFLGKPIYCLIFGKGSNRVFYSGSIHANEWIVSPVLMKFVEDLCIAYINNSSLYQYNVKKIFNNSSIYIVPMVNPDGVDLVTDNLPKNSGPYIYAKYISSVYSNIPFPNRLESKFEWCGSKFAVSCWMV